MQENRELVLNNSENKVLIQLKLDQRQEMSALQNKLAVNEIEIEEARIKQETALKTETIKAKRYESVQIIKSKADQVKEEIRAETEIKRKEGV